MKKLTEVVRDKLAKWMQAKGQSQAKVAKSLGISAATLSMFLKGTYTGDNEQIAAAAKDQHGLDLDKKKIQVAEPIKSFGKFEVPIKLHTQVTGKLNVIVQEA